MATTYPLVTLAATVTPFGISAPVYSDVYKSLQASFQTIFGSDAYVDPDSQDGQMLAVFALAIADSNNAAIAIYNAYSPQTAQGVALSNAVKINGLTRDVATNSTAVLTVTGQVGTTIIDGIVQDTDGINWDLPASVVIPVAGFINVVGTSQELGAVSADIGAINKIMTPTLGWQSVTNAAAASLGAPVELDAALRQRQALSTALPSLTVLEGIVGAVFAVTGVTQVVAYENDTNSTDSNGLPPHSIALVVLGGAADDIADAIYVKKTPGAYTYGTTVIVIVDQFGIPNNIRFFIPDEVPIKIEITVEALTGYTTAVGDLIKESLAAYINALAIGQDVLIARLYLPGQLYGGQYSETFEVTLLEISIDPAAVGGANVPVAFNERATCDVVNITVIVI